MGMQERENRGWPLRGAVARLGRVIARGSSDDLLGALPGQVRLSVDGGDIEVSTMDPVATLAELLRTVPGPVRGVDLRHPTLDDLYRALDHAP